MPDHHSINRVATREKIAFGLGMLANQMFPAALGIFIVILIEGLGFPGWMLGIIYFVPKLFDAITDPIMGFITDNTKSKWGRRRQYVLLGSVIMGLSFAFMWQLYSSDSINYNFYYFLIWSLVFYLGLTIFSVPYVAMGYEMSDDFHERTEIMATAQLIGQLAWVIAPWFWVIMYDPQFFPSSEIATRTLAVYVAFGCSILAAIPAIFIKSKSTLNENYAPLTLKNIGSSFNQIIEGFRDALKIEQFRKLCIATFLIFNAFNTVAGFSFFIIKYFIFSENPNNFGVWPTLFGSVGAIITTIAVIPIVSKMSKSLGKKKAFVVSQFISIIGYVLFWFLFIPGKPYLFLFALPFFSFGIGSLFTLMMSMTSDVIDIDELNTGKRREGIFGAIYWWMVKFGLAIAGLLSGLILSYVSFNSGADSQSFQTMFELRLFFSGIPILGTLIAIWVMKDYDVDEEKSHEISAILSKRKLINSNADQNQEAESIDQSSDLKLEKQKNVNQKVVTEINMATNSEIVETKVNFSFSSFRKDHLISKEELKQYAEIKHDHTYLDFTHITSDELRGIWHKTLNAGMHGICFSIYEDQQKPGDIITEFQVERRIKILKPYTKWVRSFSCIDGNEHVARMAKKHNMNTLVGAWLSADLELNEKEIESLISMAKQGLVDVAAVGNEVMYRKELSEEQLIEYIQRVKSAIPTIPVGYVDAYYEFTHRPNITEVCDVILTNCYPYWEGCPIEYSFDHMRSMYESAKQAGKGKRVIITETGWPSAGGSFKGSIANEENAMRYYINFQNWCNTNGIESFYFASFDESWKVGPEGDVGAYWGLWDKHENIKY